MKHQLLILIKEDTAFRLVKVQTSLLYLADSPSSIRGNTMNGKVF
jgi:hypothetical protein